ncbi:MarR family transcriptional regulator [Thioclava sp. GXIMD4216]|uniref:MarR family transcriptional regulator n=1 Tax=Thioclava sp. GXIMD4216 TaxID=3131929 RepID=UPI0030D39017
MDYAVLTGDIVGSSDLPPALIETGLAALECVAEAVPEAVWISRHRGDGWQMACEAALLDLRLALLVRASLRAVNPMLDTRIAMARGAGVIPENGDLNAAQGAGFVASGRLLDAITGAELHHAAGGAWSAAVRLADALSKSWTQKQAETLREMLALPAPSQQATAEALGKSRQAVAQALQGAGFGPISEALAQWEAA